jgi:hypothetical protein
MSRLASITPVRTARTAGDDGSNQLTIHVVQIHAHQTTNSRKKALATPPRERSSRIRCESCVTAKT